MADIMFKCPHCAQPIEAPEDMRVKMINCPNCQNPVHVHEFNSPHSRGMKPDTELQTNVKQGALIGSVTCFVIGLGFMIWSLLTFIIYGPLFFAAFVLSIVALAQKRILGGLLMLLATLILPPIIGLYLAASRAPAAAQTLNQAMDQAAADYQREAVRSLQNSMQPQMPVTGEQPRILLGLPISSARYFREQTFFAYPRIQFSVQNQTGTAVSRIFCHGRLSSPGRTVPWAEEDFNFAIPGGIEPGETKQITLPPSPSGPYGKAELKDRNDLVLEISVINAEDASGNRLSR